MKKFYLVALFFFTVGIKAECVPKIILLGEQKKISIEMGKKCQEKYEYYLKDKLTVSFCVEDLEERCRENHAKCDLQNGMYPDSILFQIARIGFVSIYSGSFEKEQKIDSLIISEYKQINCPMDIYGIDVGIGLFLKDRILFSKLKSHQWL